MIKMEKIDGAWYGGTGDKAHEISTKRVEMLQKFYERRQRPSWQRPSVMIQSLQEAIPVRQSPVILVELTR